MTGVFRICGVAEQGENALVSKLAEAHGAKAYRVIDPAKLEATIKKAVASRKTSLVEVIVEPRANVYPMIPGGKSVTEMVFG